jgi:hypothetical protein
MKHSDTHLVLFIQRATTPRTEKLNDVHIRW